VSQSIPPPTGTTAASREFRLQVTGLEVRMGRSGPDVVRDVSFAVPPGEVLGLVGESGSGKTTVALALLGHTRRGLRIAAGQVLLDGTDLLALSPRELRAARGTRVSYVPQDPSSALNPALRVGTQIREALQVHAGVVGSADDRVAEVMREVNLDPTPETLRRYPHQLSGGQQQRVALAMAFACRPSLIVLDEPTTGLDVSTQRHVLDTVRSLCRSYRVAAVYVSHDLAVVSGLVSDVAVMYAGRVVEIGPTAWLFGEPVHPYTRSLIGAVPSPGRAEILAGIDGQQPRPGHRGAGCSFAARCGYAIADCTAQAPAPVDVAGRSVRCLRATDINATRSERPSAAADVPPAVAGRDLPTLSVRQVTASYGSTPVLSGIDLDVPPRACLAVVGESGSGKTTLARCVAGLHGNWTGEITFQGSPLARTARQRGKGTLRQVQYVFQNPYTSLNPRKTVGQIIDQQLEQLTSLSRRDRSARVAGVLDDVALGQDLLSCYPDQLSGGERQRVAIARALAVEPDLLICDEVTSSLDVSVQATIVELLRRIQREQHLAMLFITHNLALVRSIAQSAVVLHQGTVVESGPAEQILDHPASPYTQRLVEDAPRLSQPPGSMPRFQQRWVRSKS
jgi:peptide/nickel transport system ATP-binding protein